MQFLNGSTLTTWCSVESEFHGPVSIYKVLLRVKLPPGIETLALAPLRLGDPYLDSKPINQVMVSKLKFMVCLSCKGNAPGARPYLSPQSFTFHLGIPNLHPALL